MPSGEIKSAIAAQRVGQRFGLLLILQHLGSNKYRYARYLCQCDCGKQCEKTWPFSTIEPNCGCLAQDRRNVGVTKHGQSRRLTGSTRCYTIWSNMKSRCQNPNNQDYALYGGRGIQIAPAWQIFENFYKDMGNPPERMTLDRIDTDGPYSKENCHWITQQQNCQNKRNNILTPELVRMIRQKHAIGLDITTIAADLELPYRPVYHVIKGTTWTNIV